MDRELLLEQMRELPIVQYEFFETAELTFTDRVRTVCEVECPQYGKSWACPPAWVPWRRAGRAASAIPTAFSSPP